MPPLDRKAVDKEPRPAGPLYYTIETDGGDVVGLVIDNESEMSHWFPLPGHFFRMLGLDAEHAGKCDGQPLNKGHPIEKDTFSISIKGWAVVQWEADNPGIWFFSCHIEWHLVTGMAILVIEGDALQETTNALETS